MAGAETSLYKEALNTAVIAGQNNKELQLIMKESLKLRYQETLMQKLSPSFPSISNFVKNHILISIIYSLWFLINLILLISGSGHSHFWPYIHTSGGYYDKFYLGGTYIKESTNFDWSLKYYGWAEFIIYVFIIPIVVFSIYTLYKRFEKNQSKAFLTPPNIYKK